MYFHINLQWMRHQSPMISYESIIAMMGFQSIYPYTITYDNGIDGSAGSLQKGESVTLVSGMGFDVQRAE